MQSRRTSISRSIYERAILIDTSVLYALADPRDNYHTEAVECLKLIEANHLPLWVTNTIIVEAHDGILQGLGKKASLSFLSNIRDGSVAIERASEEDEKDAESYLYKYGDQTISYVDALSFTIMKRLGIGTAFTFDRHFSIVGFVKIPPFFL